MLYVKLFINIIEHYLYDPGYFKLDSKKRNKQRLTLLIVGVINTINYQEIGNMPKTFGPAPDAWKAGHRNYGVGLILQTAKKMLEAGEKEAVKQGVPMSMAISDSSGNLLAFERMENAMLGSIQIALDKAYTAVFGKQATAEFSGAYKAGVLIPLFFHERWITFPGGFPLIKDGLIMGGFGVSGGIIEDLFVARSALEHGGFSTVEVDQILERNENKS